MKTTFNFLALLISISFFSQTKLIAFKSHSGHLENFNTAVSENLFDTNTSNLGVIPQKFVKDAKLDSVIILNEEESILVTSSAHKRVLKGATREWRPGRETVYNHGLFSKKNIDSVKTVLKRDYHFVNDMDSVVFMEYDKESKSYKKFRPSTAKPEKERSGKTKGGLLLGILMISGASGFYSWKRNKKNNGK
ncbi:hypothetical protein [Chryseobacterium shigense]|uniref:Uncharacterized protein n=1 Tax=Chryseobacterium shigense TaxID=297244 RepID=A0A841NJR4_9FLAO|nr:hypothetical protein [Chryseobacterium shigense]MBB6371499.1 hypothetical protein [Chryseobacterium shigense]